MYAAPAILIQKSFAATTSAPFQVPEQNEGVNVPFSYIPSRWALQVTGLNAAGAITAPSAWDVIIQPSLDGIAWNDMSTPMLEHVNGTNGNGDVVWSGAAGATFRGLRFLKIDVKTLTLGTATKILVTLMGLK